MSIWYAGTDIDYSTTGDGTSEGTRTNLAHAMQTLAAAGDTIYFKRDSTTPTWEYDSDGNGSLPLLQGLAIIGYSGTVGDEGMPEIVDLNGNTNPLFTVTVASAMIANLKVYNSYRCIHATAGTAQGCIFDNIHSENAGENDFWWYGPTTSDGTTFTRCTSIGSTLASFLNNSRCTRFINCLSISGGGDGFYESDSDYGGIMFNCVSQESTGYKGFRLKGPSFLVNCVSNRSIEAAFSTLIGGYGAIFLNCVAANSGTYAWEAVVPIFNMAIRSHCAVYNNTNGDVNDSTMSFIYDLSTVSGEDPLFNNENPGNWQLLDLRVGAGSPLTNKGAKWADGFSSMN